MFKDSDSSKKPHVAIISEQQLDSGGEEKEKDKNPSLKIDQVDREEGGHNDRAIAKKFDVNCGRNVTDYKSHENDQLYKNERCPDTLQNSESIMNSVEKSHRQPQNKDDTALNDEAKKSKSDLESAE